MCKISIKYQYASREGSAYVHIFQKFFRKDQGVRLLKHVR